MRRREWLRTSGIMGTVGVAGCLEPTGDDADGTSDTSGGGRGDDQDWPPSHFSFQLDETKETGGAINFDVQFLDRLGASIPEYHSTVQPAVAELRLRNAGDERKTVTFDGFVPFPNPVAESSLSDEVLAVIPRDEALHQLLDGATQPPEYERIGDYWEFTEPFDPPTTSTAVTLAPGDEIGGEHVFIAGHGDIGEDNASQPHPSRYAFESTVAVDGAERNRSEIPLEFAVLVHSSAP